MTRPNWLQRRRATCGAVALLVLSHASTLSAQVPTTNPPLPPPPPVVAPAPSAPTAPQEIELVRGRANAPAGSEAVFFRLGDVLVSGEFPQLSASSRRLVEPRIDTRQSVADIYDLAAQIQAMYFRSGFPLARVVVPAQDFATDRSLVRLLIIDGFIEQIDGSTLPDSVRKAVLRNLQPLVGRRRLTESTLALHTLMAGDIAGIALRSAIAPGEREGGVKLIVTGVEVPFTALASIDNGLSDDLGKRQATVAVSLQSLLHLGEIVSLVYSARPDSEFLGAGDPTRRYLDASLRVPFGMHGMSILGDYAVSETNTIGVVQVHSDFTRGLVRLSKPFIRERSVNLYGWVGFEAIDQSQELINFFPGAVLGRDRLRVVRAGFEGGRVSRDGALTQYSVRVSHGMNGLGARGIDDATADFPLSRIGAQPTFDSVLATAERTDRWHQHLETFVSASVQSSYGHPLLTAEQLVFGGHGQISGLETGALPADQGGYVRGELRLPLFETVGWVETNFKPYVFGAWGIARLEEPTVIEREATRVVAYGLGATVRTLGLPQVLRARAVDRTYVDAYLEVGRADLHDGPSNNRFSFGLTAHF